MFWLNITIGEIHPLPKGKGFSFTQIIKSLMYTPIGMPNISGIIIVDMIGYFLLITLICSCGYKFSVISLTSP